MTARSDAIRDAIDQAIRREQWDYVRELYGCLAREAERPGTTCLVCRHIGTVAR